MLPKRVDFTFKALKKQNEQINIEKID